MNFSRQLLPDQFVNRVTRSCSSRFSLDQGPRLNRRHFLGGLLALGGVAAGAAIANDYYPLAGLSDDLVTSTGERRLHRLPDGSRLLLDARTRINLSLDGSEHVLHLLEGALALTIQPDSPASFLIRTAEGTIRLHGPRVMVRQQVRRTLVAASDNEVEIQTASGTLALIPAGVGVRFDKTHVSCRSGLLADAAWETGWIDARNRPLADVIAALRPYRQGSLQISVAAGGLLANGLYPLDDTDAALRALETDMPIQIRRITPWFTSIGLASA